MTALSDELKPCPFCGGAAALLPRTCDKNTPYNPADRAFPVARCGQCGAEALGKDWGKPETAAEKWNTRALLAEQAQEPKAEDAPSDDELKDLAHSAYEEAMSFGLSVDTFLRYFKGIRNHAAIAAERKA